jgi:hypothetical protein
VRQLILAVLCSVACNAPAPLPAPAPPPAPPELPAPPAPAEQCRGYCATITRCWPEFAYAECDADCLQLLSNPEASAVSGFTPALVQCWSVATSCQLAAACDAAAEGERK